MKSGDKIIALRKTKSIDKFAKGMRDIRQGEVLRVFELEQKPKGLILLVGFGHGRYLKSDFKLVEST